VNSDVFYGRQVIKFLGRLGCGAKWNSSILSTKGPVPGISLSTDGKGPCINPLTGSSFGQSPLFHVPEKSIFSLPIGYNCHMGPDLVDKATPYQFRCLSWERSAWPIVWKYEAVSLFVRYVAISRCICSRLGAPSISHRSLRP
jgi:hypothetical protein